MIHPRPRVRLLAIFVLALLCHSASAAPDTAPASAPSSLEKPTLKIDETVLYHIPGEVKVDDTLVSPDSRHVACVEERTTATRRMYDVSIDGTPGPRFQWIVGRSLFFSPDGSRFTYQTQDDGPISVIVDSVSRFHGEGGAKPQANDANGVAPAGKGCWMAGHVTFSPDGRRYAYAAQTEKGRHFLVADGKEIGPYDGLDEWQIRFSPAGDHLAYRARLNAGGAAGAPAPREFIVLDGKSGPAFDGASGPLFSDNGGRFAYQAKQGKLEFYVVDGKLGPGYDLVAGLTFSADGRRYAYAGGQGGKQMLVVDGKAYKPFDGLGELAFSPDGRRVAAAVQTGGRWGVALDGAASGQYDGVAGLTFSPDGRRLAFIAGANGRRWVVADGRDGPPFLAVTGVTFSPDSRHYAYIAVDPLGKFVVLDGRRVGPGDSFAFSPDGRHFARTVPYPDGHWVLAVDGTESDARYDGFPIGNQIVFDSPDTFRIVGRRGNDLMRIDVHIR